MNTRIVLHSRIFIVICLLGPKIKYTCYRFCLIMESFKFTFLISLLSPLYSGFCNAPLLSRSSSLNFHSATALGSMVAPPGSDRALSYSPLNIFIRFPLNSTRSAREQPVKEDFYYSMIVPSHCWAQCGLDILYTFIKMKKPHRYLD